MFENVQRKIKDSKVYNKNFYKVVKMVLELYKNNNQPGHIKNFIDYFFPTEEDSKVIIHNATYSENLLSGLMKMLACVDVETRTKLRRLIDIIVVERWDSGRLTSEYYKLVELTDLFDEITKMLDAADNLLEYVNKYTWYATKKTSLVNTDIEAKWHVIKHLLDVNPHLANLNDKILHDDNKGANVLLLAAADKQWDLVRFFIDKGVDLTAKFESGPGKYSGSPNNKGANVLLLAAADKQWDLVRFFIDKDVDLTAKFEDGPNKSVNALLLAAAVKQLDLVTLFIDKGLDLTAKFEDGRLKDMTTLSMSVMDGHWDTVREILNKLDSNDVKQQLDNKDPVTGNTILSYIAREEKYELLRIANTKGYSFEKNNILKTLLQFSDEIIDAIQKHDSMSDYICPISKRLMIDPVTISTGHTYEKYHITRVLKQGDGHGRCPLTREYFTQIPQTSFLLVKFIAEKIQELGSAILKKRVENNTLHLNLTSQQSLVKMPKINDWSSTPTYDNERHYNSTGCASLPADDVWFNNSWLSEKNINDLYEDGHTALTYSLSVVSIDYNFVKYIILHMNADVKIANKQGITPLNILLNRYSNEDNNKLNALIELLMKNGAIVDASLRLLAQEKGCAHLFPKDPNAIKYVI